MIKNIDVGNDDFDGEIFLLSLFIDLDLEFRIIMLDFDIVVKIV